MNHRDIYRPGDRVRVHPMGYPSVLRGAEGVVARVLWDGAGIVIRLPDGSERLVDYSYILPAAADEGD